MDYLAILKSEISPALGCTEPAAAALASAHAARCLGTAVDRLELRVSQYILKNGMNVGIPGTGMIGLDIAAALGALSAAPDRELLVLNGLSADQKEAAREMVRNHTVQIGLAETAEKVYIQAIAFGGEHTAEAVISGTHTNLVLLRKDEAVLLEKAQEKPRGEQQKTDDEAMTLEGIVRFVDAVEVSQLEFLSEVIRINRSIAEEGLTNDYGLKVGKTILEGGRANLISNDVASFAVACTAAAADARMSGCDKPVMSTAGSGNQGLTASLPVAAIGWKLELPPETVLRALAASILVTIHAKRHIGRLSVLCGCSIAAAIGSCCGIIYLFDGGLEAMQRGVSTMVADISGVVCDGAKPGCALKIATAVNSAIRSATMALNGLGADFHDGIVSMDVEKTFQNLGTLGNEGMADTNAAILTMMLQKG